MADDYGYFGSGDEGYAHYVAASGEDRDPKGGGSNGGGNKGGGFPRIGCFGTIMIFIVICVIFSMFD